MKHKLTYSLLLSLVVLFSFDLALAQNVTVVGPTTDLHPNTAYSYDVVLDNGTGITAFTLPVVVSGAGFQSGSVAVTLGVATAYTQVGDQVLLGYNGPDLGAGPLILATLTLTTASTCGETFTIETGSMPPAGVMRFAGCPGCNVPATFTGLTGTLYDGTPVCGTNLDENLVCGGSIVNKQINASDPIGLPLTYTLKTGPGSVDLNTGVYNYTPAGNSCDFTALVEIEVENPCGNKVTCPFNVIYNQEAPVLTVPANQSYHWTLGPQVVNASATDDACPTPHNLVFSIVSVVPSLAGISIVSTTGAITIDPACADIAGSPHVVTVKVDDGCESDQETFSVTVTNAAPIIACPADIGPWLPGDPIDAAFTASDPNSDPIVVTILSTTKNGTPVPVPAGMVLVGPPYGFQWTPAVGDLGHWVVTLQVDDGCFQATCSFDIQVFKFHLSLSDTTKVLPGHNAVVYLSFNDTLGIGGLDLTITYGLGGLSFLFAEPEGVLENWEYFTFRKSQMDNCGGGCPTGIIHLIGIANMPNGVNPDPSIYYPGGDIASMTFSTPTDLSFIGQCFHLSWAWFDCTDNVLSSVTGDTLFVAVGIDPACIEGFKDVTPKPVINFDDGMICIIPPPDDRGDINLNGVANEISDAVLYSNYFIYGPLVLHDDPPPDYFDNRVLASDINDDGVPLTIADLVYLIRIITGDANPYPESGEGGKVAPYATMADVSYTLGDKMTVSAYTMADVGGAAFVFRHSAEVGAPVLNEEFGNMTLKFSDRNGELRVLVYSMGGNTIPAGVCQLFTVPMGEGAMELVEAQFSDAQGNLMAVNTAKGSVPTVYELSQNYPNPFNAGTVIRFALPSASDWTIRIYNVAGQLVDEFSGRGEGYQTLTWNPKNAASGIYFYKLAAGNFTDTKKMVLMK